MIVLDTNVVSELMRPTPDPAVVSWLDTQQADDVWLTAMTAAELLAGVTQLPDGARKRQLADRVGTLLTDVFADRILPFGGLEAPAYAAVLAARRTAGAPISTADAICVAAGVDRLVTRNTADFAGVGLELVDPWSTARPEGLEPPTF